MIELPPDVTFVIQVVSFLIFWQLMRRVLFEPVQAVLAARATRTSGTRERAAELVRERETIAAEIETRLGEARSQAASAAAEVRRAGESEEQQVLARYRDEALGLLERERGVTAAQVDAARVPLRSDAERLAGDVVSKVLGRTV